MAPVRIFLVLLLGNAIHCQNQSKASILKSLLENRPEKKHCGTKRNSEITSDLCYTISPGLYGGNFAKDVIPTPNEIMEQDEFQFLDRNCFCDKQCLEYGDCCIDVALNHQQWKHASRKWVCSPLLGAVHLVRNIYTIGRCASSWQDSDVKSQCEMNPSFNLDYIHYIPVASVTSKTLYRNIYCAICNNDSENIKKWATNIQCTINTPVKDLLAEGKLRSDKFNPVEGSWSVVDHRGRKGKCLLQITDFRRNSTQIAKKYNARACKLPVASCSEKASKYAEFCKLYTSYLYEPFGVFYKNAYCAMCNNVSLSKLTCAYPFPLTQRSIFRTSMSILFDFNLKSGQLVGRKGNLCEEGSFWDPLRKRCLGFQCGSLYKLQDGKCVRDENVVVRNGSLLIDCLTVELFPGEFILMPNDSVLVNQTNKLYRNGEYELMDSLNESYSGIYICKEDHLVPLFKFSPLQSLLSQVCLSISIICLIFHVAMYCMVQKLRNLPGKNLLCLSCSLLVGQLLFLFGVKIGAHVPCVVIAVAMHFFFLAYFFWMNAMAADIFCTFKSNSYRRKVGNKLFVKYMCYAWLTPSVIVILGIIFDHMEGVELSFRPGYGNGLCWINHKNGLILLFIVPIAIIMLLNIVMFSLTASYIKKSNEASKRAIKRSDKVRYILYIKLAIIMGLTWIFAFLAAFVESEATWFLYIILNGLQGAFIFFAFSCKKKVFKQAAESVSSSSSFFSRSSKDNSKGRKNFSSNKSGSFNTQVSTDGVKEKVEIAERPLNSTV